ncbi:hypothetical protein SATMO3_44340 [Sporomusa aerivorans]
MKKTTWLEIMLVLIVAGFIMSFQLGGLPLLDPDEPVYAQTAEKCWLRTTLYHQESMGISGMTNHRCIIGL